MKFVFYSVVVFLFCLASAIASNKGFGKKELSRDDIGQLSLKNMKRMLDERGVECKGCVLKDHFAEKVFEAQGLPVLKQKKTTQTKLKSPQDDENIAEVNDCLALINCSNF